MALAVEILRTTLVTFLDILQLLFLVSAICSWVDPDRSGSFSAFLYAVTEPIIFPLRALFDRFHWFEGFPVDMPFLLTWLLLSALQAFLVMV